MLKKLFAFKSMYRNRSVPCCQQTSHRFITVHTESALHQTPLITIHTNCNYDRFDNKMQPVSEVKSITKSPSRNNLRAGAVFV